MAISEHTQLAPAGKADEAERLLSDMLSALETAGQNLRRLKQWPDKSSLAEETNLLQSVLTDVLDAEDSIEALLEDLTKLQ